ncbi:MAG: hypothetical protein WB646_18940 [Steroidobacteraceae bacterium]
MTRKRLAQLSVIVPALLLYGCGSSHSPGDARSGTAAARAGSKQAGAAPNDSIDADMVAAVSAGGSGPPIGVKFRLETRPVVGAPAQLVLALLPTPGLSISHIHASLQPEDGLQLLSPRTFDIDDPQDGATLAQDVTVVPQREGVLSLSAVVVVDYNAISIARTYVIPLIASAS